MAVNVLRYVIPTQFQPWTHYTFFPKLMSANSDRYASTKQKLGYLGGGGGGR